MASVHSLATSVAQVKTEMEELPKDPFFDPSDPFLPKMEVRVSLPLAS